MEKFGNSSSTEVNASEIERFIDEKFGEIITANTEKKSHRYREYDKGCHANVDEMNIKLAIGVVTRLYKIKNGRGN